MVSNWLSVVDHRRGGDAALFLAPDTEGMLPQMGEAKPLPVSIVAARCGRSAPAVGLRFRRLLSSERRRPPSHQPIQYWSPMDAASAGGVTYDRRIPS